MFKSIYILIIAALAITSCNPNKQSKQEETMRKDDHSFSHPDEVIIDHINLDLKVDFSKKQLYGYATLEINNIKGVTTLHLDTKDLDIDSVWIDDSTPTTFELKPEVKYLGKELIVEITPETNSVKIKYATAPTSAALQWLTPSQTAGKLHPFLFTQSQAILARTWIPLQDSPGVRFTYTATIQCPTNLMALMSAENDTVLHDDGIYKFNMPQRIPSYLMALTVGDVRFHKYDERSGVYAEPITLEKAAYEFVDMPKMITAAEELYGPYAWGRYDVIVLPPSFPFGGMENPRLTFATPTIIAGDRSLVSLIAHELAHSWSGNLVTNATWNDFWLNEGFTVYFEARIMEKLYGKDYADMLTVLSKGELDSTILELGANSPDTHLYLNLKDRDPDDGMNDIAYEKGRFFLTTIEQAIGREKWDKFLNNYFKANAFKSITTTDFIEYLNDEIINGDTELAKKIDAQAWIYGPGLPLNCVQINSSELDKASKEALAFSNGIAAKNLTTTNWTTHHWLFFLRKLPEHMSYQQMKDLDKSFHLTESGNNELLCEWLQICILNNYNDADNAVEEFLTHVGRRKFVKPLFDALISTPQGKAKAKQIYKRTRSGYHTVTTTTIDEMLK